MSKPRITLNDHVIDADLQALADEIAANTGVSPATALDLALRQRPTLRQYAGQWNAAVRRARAAQRSSEQPEDSSTPTA